MAKTAKSKIKYPNQISVVREFAKSESYLVAEEAPEAFADFDADVEVAVYQLMRVVTVKTKTEVV